MRPPNTIVVKDAAGVPRQVDPVDAQEIVKEGGSWEVTEKDMHEATTAPGDHPVGVSGYEHIEEPVVKLVDTVGAMAGEAAKNDPKFKADAEAGQAATDGQAIEPKKTATKKK